MLLHPRPVIVRGLRTDRIDQPHRLVGQLAVRRREHRAQRRRLFHRVGDRLFRRDRKGAGDVDMRRRNPECEKPVRPVEPLLVIVDQAAAGVRHEHARNCDPDMADCGLAGYGPADVGVTTVGGDQQIDVIEALALAVLRPFDFGFFKIGRAARNARDDAVIGDHRAGRFAQHAIEFGPADAPSRVIRDLRQRQMEQDRSVSQRGAPAIPCETGDVHLRQ